MHQEAVMHIKVSLQKALLPAFGAICGDREWMLDELQLLTINDICMQLAGRPRLILGAPWCMRYFCTSSRSRVLRLRKHKHSSVFGDSHASADLFKPPCHIGRQPIDTIKYLIKSRISSE